MSPRAPRFTDEPWVVALLLLCLPPLGLVALALTPAMTRTSKALAAGVLLGGALAVGLYESSTGNLSETWRHARAGALQRAAVGLRRAGRHEAARAAGEEAWALAPEVKVVARSNSHLAEQVGDRDARLRWLERATRAEEGGELDPDSPARWRVELGTLLLEEGRLAEVEELLEGLADPRGKRAGAPALRAGLLLARGRPKEAEEAARQLLADFQVNRFGEAYWQIARAAEAQGDLRRAAYYLLESARHGAPEPAHVVEARGLDLATRAGLDPVPVRAFLRAIQLRGPFGGADQDEEGAARAEEILAKLDAAHPGFFAGDLVLHTRGSYFFYQTEEWEKALELYERALARYPRGETRCRNLYQVVRTLRKLERLDEAEVRAQRCVRACPGELGASARGQLRQIRRQRLRKDREES